MTPGVIKLTNLLDSEHSCDLAAPAPRAAMDDLDNIILETLKDIGWYSISVLVSFT